MGTSLSMRLLFIVSGYQHFGEPDCCAGRNFFLRSVYHTYQGLEVTSLRFAILSLLACLTAGAQTQAPATFGVRIPVPGTFTDLVLDEGRQRLYLVNNANNRIRSEER